MDPGDDQSRSIPSGLPRTRGDGPISDKLPPCIRSAPPHTRGWTAAPGAGGRGGGGSPAHAGMDPIWTLRTCASRWLPRTRGDGPTSTDCTANGCSAPPHTRGWTLVTVHVRPPPDGSPAHAGMDPRRRCVAASSARLPRTRGDGPLSSPITVIWLMAPPHTRGWTASCAAVRPPVCGSPAHAGMDRLSGQHNTGSVRLPRTRGDGPAREMDVEAAWRAPPHTRGWTLAVLDDDQLQGGSPAHAGMDRSESVAWHVLPRLPRTRGDGPWRSHRASAWLLAPPHTRGWTQR